MEKSDVNFRYINSKSTGICSNCLNSSLVMSGNFNINNPEISCDILKHLIVGRICTCDMWTDKDYINELEYMVSKQHELL